MEIKLSVKDRLLLLPMLPQSGGRMEMVLVNELTKLIEFTPEEIGEFQLKDAPGGMVIGNPLKFKDKEFSFTDSQIKILKQSSKKTDDARQVTIDMLPLLDKIDHL